jgi:hypothetical protein
MFKNGFVFVFVFVFCLLCFMFLVYCGGLIVIIAGAATTESPLVHHIHAFLQACTIHVHHCQLSCTICMHHCKLTRLWLCVFAGSAQPLMATQRVVTLRAVP